MWCSAVSCHVVCSAVQPPNVVRACSVFTILPSKCASRHNGTHFFDISTSKSAPRSPIFYTFDFEICFAHASRRCFAPQRPALFQHLNFQKCSKPGVFCTFWLGNVVRAATECTFSAQLPKVVCDPQIFCTFLTWKCASHHNRVRFFNISTSKSGPALWYETFGL